MPRISLGEGQTAKCDHLQYNTYYAYQYVAVEYEAFNYNALAQQVAEFITFQISRDHREQFMLGGWKRDIVAIDHQ